MSKEAEVRTHGGPRGQGQPALQWVGFGPRSGLRQGFGQTSGKRGPPIRAANLVSMRVGRAGGTGVEQTHSKSWGKRQGHKREGGGFCRTGKRGRMSEPPSSLG